MLRALRALTAVLRRAPRVPPGIETVAPRWPAGLVLVCQECTRKVVEAAPPDGEQRDLRKWLKARLKADGAWGPLRVVSSSCLDVCPEGKVTVAFGDAAVGRGRCLVVHPVRDREALHGLVRAVQARRTRRTLR